MLKRNGLKLALFSMIVIVAVVATILILTINGTNRLVDGMLKEQSLAANNGFQNTLQGYQDSALERAEIIAASREVVAAVESGDHAALVRALNNLSRGFDLITLCDVDGTVLARTHNDKIGDSVMGQKAIATALSTGKGISTIEPGTVIGLSTRGSAAIKDASGRVIGALTCGNDLSLPKYVDLVKEQHGCEVTFFAGDERMSTTIVDEGGNRVVGTKASPLVVEAVLEKQQDYTSRLPLFGAMYEVYYSPVIVNGQAIGMLFTGQPIDHVLLQERNMVLQITVAAVMLVLAVLITAFVIRWTTRKSYWYESILDSIPFPISVTGMDKNWTFINRAVEQMLGTSRAQVIGKPCSNWGATICKTGNCGITCLENGKDSTLFEQADMDFKVNVSFLLDKKKKHVGHIEVVQDISDMVKTQKAQAGLVEKISGVSGTYVNTSRQIADSAQSLAQGASEQAATVQQISASVTDMAEKTTNNANLAGKAAEVADTIKHNAETSSLQMDRMIDAVREINDASQSIGRVIKVIDDIAFQTNILALNAAVEAARAGQHGKGFAVVADEVRNLAAKSAGAAKDTGALISNSIEKANQGTGIANETAVSLAGIVSGIDESSRIIKEIAEVSKEQSTSIVEINQAIEQVAQVVHKNSATAEESAAASEEMSSQASILQELVDQFGQKKGPEQGSARAPVASLDAGFSL